MAHSDFFKITVLLYGLIFLGLAIEPLDRETWLLENVLVIFAVPILILTYRKFPFSRISYFLIFIFLLFHSIGAHYTYSLVPYDEFFINYFNFSLNDALSWERNNFDRFIHFAYGFFLVYPTREICYRIAGTNGFWGYLFPLVLTMAGSVIYELIEWGAALIFGGDLGVAYVGTQGDVWDAQKDMALATLGAILAMLITLVINLKRQRGFSKEWDESLSIKDNNPMG